MKEKQNPAFFDDDKFFITIRNSSDSDWAIQHNVDRYVLRLTFDDIVDEDSDGKLFNAKQARKIKSFVDNLNPKKLLFINCETGTSRSIAIGEVINEYLNNFLVNNQEDYTYFLKNNDTQLSNQYVKSILYKEFFGENI
jgi:predicted protein tyrosine phosphatase